MDVTRIAIAQTPVQLAVAREVQDQLKAQGEAVVQLLESSQQSGTGAQNASGQGRFVDARA